MTNSMRYRRTTYRTKKLSGLSPGLRRLIAGVQIGAKAGTCLLHGAPPMSDTSQPGGQYLRRLELATDRILDAVRRLKPRDRLWGLNAALRQALDEAQTDQATRSLRRPPSTS